MTLLDALLPRQEPVAMVAKPKKRRRWRISQADRQVAEEKLAEQLRQRRQEQAERMQGEQDDLLEKASELPQGIRIVGQDQEVGQVGQDGADR